MKPSALTMIVCPFCRNELELSVLLKEGQEILEGALACGHCERTFPITRGVPRFVPENTYAASFGREWAWFRTVQIDSLNQSAASERALSATTGWRDNEYAGRRLLDAGVGAGRFAERAAAKGAEVFGVDLTTAIDAAYRNIGSRPHVHLVQADIFALPFRDQSFDLAYSIGVLHHTPDTRAAFARVAAMIRPCGKFAVYIYAGYGPSHKGSDLLRKVTTKLPLRIMWALSSAAIPLYYAYRIPGVGKLFQLVAPISMQPSSRWRWLDTFDWYTPSFQWKHLYPEVFRWFQENNFHDVEIFDGPIRMCGTKRAEPASAHLRTFPRLVAS
jgi:SAM-dependent methyltransferase